MPKQTVVLQNPALGLPGVRYTLNEPYDADSAFVAATETAGLAPGLLYMYDTDRNFILPRGQAADPDAIQLSLASPVAPTEYNSGTFDGVVADSVLPVAAPITLTLSNNVDWDATNATLVYVNGDGTQVTETLAIPDGGNTTLTSAEAATQIISLTIPAQSGTNGTFEIGYAASTELAFAYIAGIGIRNTSQEETTVTPVNRTAAALQEGRIWVTTDQTVTIGQRAYVRINDAVTPAYGVFRGDADAGDAVLVPHCQFVKVASATLAAVRFALPF